MSELRRRMMMQQAATGYVQDGLIMFLDCLDTANCANNSWTSSVGNYTFTGNSEWSTRGYKFNGHNSGTYLKRDYSIFAGLDFKATVEIVFETVNCDSGYYLYADGDWNGALLQCTFNNTNKYITTWSNDRNSTTNGKVFQMSSPIPNNNCCLSEAYDGMDYSKKVGYLNLSKLTAVNNVQSLFSHTGGYASIGARYQNGSFSNWGGFSGYIKAIRIYNRALTEAEILNNQQVDNIRYNLGLLTLPTIAYMLDIVNEVFYTNAGSGSLIVGPDVN